MKRKKSTIKSILIISSAILFSLTGCHKATESGSTTQKFDSLESEVIQDFTNDLVFFRYSSLLNSCVTMQTSVASLTNQTTDSNLAQAKLDWKNMRSNWEQSEGFPIGPDESKDYDPNTDTWPTDYVQMDSLLNSANPLSKDDVKNATIMGTGSATENNRNCFLSSRWPGKND